jgi:hypothetical protein
VKCAAGTYQSSFGACIICPTGTWSSASLTACKSCPGGQYTTTHLSCLDCPAGEYSKRNSDGCLKCGKRADHTQNKCVPCEAGYYSSASSDSCTPCAPGQYSPERSQRCVDCLPSYYSPNPSQKCLKCPAGEYSKAKASACSTCSPGTYVNSAQTRCTKYPSPPVSTPAPTMKPNGRSECKAGTYKDLTDPVGCKKCPDKQFSYAGAYYCQYCPLVSIPNADQSDCVGPPNPGPYRPPTPSPTLAPTYPPPSECKAGTYKDLTDPVGCKKCPDRQYSYAGAYECKYCYFVMVPNADQSDCVGRTLPPTPPPAEW